MKKIAAFALLATAAAAASAQSSVTLFGIFDANVRHVKNGDASLNSVSNNGVNSSRLGFRGTEDLGGGLKAGFWLEHGFNSDTGTQSDAARFWNRRSTVSLSGSFGEIRLGRDYTPTFGGFADFDVFGTNGVGTADKFSSVLGSGADTATRSDNLVSYFLPALGGVYGQVSLAPSENAVGKKYYGGRLGYAAGPLNVSVAYGQTTVNPVLGSDKFKSLDVGASYNLGVVKLSGYVQQNKAGKQKLTNLYAGASVPVAGTGELRVSYLHADADGNTATGASVDANDANQIAVGYVQHLSKRTALYGTLARVNNKGAATFAVAGGPTLAAGKNSTGYEFGLRHSF